MKHKIDLTPFTSNYSPKDIMNMIRSINFGTLFGEDFEKNIKENSLEDISPKKAQERVYMCINKETPLSSVQFYSQEWDLLFTYPWNGEINQNRDKTFSPVPCSGLENAISIDEIKACATESGRIAIKTHFLSISKVGLIQENISTCLYDKNGKRFYYRLGPVATSDYPFKHLVTKPGKFKYTDFDMIRKNGDTFVDYVRENSKH